MKTFCNARKEAESDTRRIQDSYATYDRRKSLQIAITVVRHPQKLVTPQLYCVLLRVTSQHNTQCVQDHTQGKITDKQRREVDDEGTPMNGRENAQAQCSWKTLNNGWTKGAKYGHVREIFSRSCPTQNLKKAGEREGSARVTMTPAANTVAEELHWQ